MDTTRGAYDEVYVYAMGRPGFILQHVVDAFGARLMWGALVPGREGGLLNARLRYFDPVRRRAGVPEDVAALVSALDDHRTVVTLVNVGATATRTVIVQAGAYGEHQFESVAWNGRTQRLDARDFTVRLAPGAGATLTIAMRRYANTPTVAFPWDRR